MKKGTLKKNSFIQGTLIASLSIIIIKILGAVYVIPFYKIIGESGGTLYSYAYSIYNLFLNISTAGIPIAMSMIISEYLALNMLDAKERAYSIGKKMISVLAIISFCIVFFGSEILAKFILSDVVGGHSIEEVSLVIKSISFCLLVIPFLSVTRGYFQGHKFISPTSFSQLLEQVVRILIVICGSYLAIKVFNTEVSIGVAVSLLGAFFGGVIAYVFLKRKFAKNKKEFPTTKKRDMVQDKTIAKKILAYCIPLVLIAVTDNIYTLVDIKLIIKGLNMIGYSAMNSEIISGIVSTWAPKICTIIIAIATGLTTNIIPHVTTSFIKKDMNAVNRRINQALSTMLIVTVPLSILLFIFSKESYYIFYGLSDYGSLVLKFSAISHLFFGIWTVLNSILQSMKKFKIIYINTISGLVTNAILDIPLILLLNKLGLSAFVATIIATCIGYIVSITIAVTYLKKEMKFDFKFTLNTLKRLILPIVCLLIPILISGYFINYELSFMSSILSLGIHGILGMLIYILISYKTGLLYDVLGEEFVNGILIKLHLKK